MKKILIIPLLFCFCRSFSQADQPRILLGTSVTTGMTFLYKDTLHTRIYHPPLYVIGNDIYLDTSRSTYWRDDNLNLYYTGTKNVEIGDPTHTARGKLEVTVNNIGSPTTPDDSLAFVIANNTASTSASAAVQQQAPAIRFRSHGWYSALSKDSMFDFKIQPYVSAFNSGGLYFQSRGGGIGGFTTNYTFTSGGVFIAQTSVNSVTMIASGGISGLTLIANVGGITTTSTGGILSNSASNSTITAPVRWSPYISWNAAAWDTLASANRAVVFGSEARPISLSSNISGSWNLWYGFNGGAHTDLLSVKSNGAFMFPFTNTTTGTTGAQTINKISGTVNIAAAGTTITVTNSLVATTSIVFAVIRTNDATARIANVVPSAGSFVINLTAATTAETSIGFWVIN